MRGMEIAIGPNSSLRSQIVRRSQFLGRNDAMLRPEEQVRANQKEKWGRKAVFQAEEWACEKGQEQEEVYGFGK